MFFVKEVAKAKDDNPTFAGQGCVTLWGKGDQWVERYGEYAEKTQTVKQFDPWFGREYGYKRICDAKRSYVYKNHDPERYWDYEVSIIWKDCGEEETE